MSIKLTHSDVRALAKGLRKPTEDAIKHSQILEDIAGSLGMKPDAMMHYLKSAEKKRGEGTPSGPASQPQNALDIGEHFPETLSRRLSARLGDRGSLVSPYLVLLVLALAIKRSPADVGRELGGETYVRPGKVLVYDEFHRISRQDPAETFRTMFPVYYIREDSLQALGTPIGTKSLEPVGAGWYRGER